MSSYLQYCTLISEPPRGEGIVHAKRRNPEPLGGGDHLARGINKYDAADIFEERDLYLLFKFAKRGGRGKFIYDPLGRVSSGRGGKVALFFGKEETELPGPSLWTVA